METSLMLLGLVCPLDLIKYTIPYHTIPYHTIPIQRLIRRSGLRTYENTSLLHMRTSRHPKEPVSGLNDLTSRTGYDTIRISI